ncbi:hypothetical protein GCM10022282_00730 [Agromyces indicus]
MVDRRPPATWNPIVVLPVAEGEGELARSCDAGNGVSRETCGARAHPTAAGLRVFHVKRRGFRTLLLWTAEGPGSRLPQARGARPPSGRSQGTAVIGTWMWSSCGVVRMAGSLRAPGE